MAYGVIGLIDSIAAAPRSPQAERLRLGRLAFASVCLKALQVAVWLAVGNLAPQLMVPLLMLCAVHLSAEGMSKLVGTVPSCHLGRDALVSDVAISCLAAWALVAATSLDCLPTVVLNIGLILSLSGVIWGGAALARTAVCGEERRATVVAKALSAASLLLAVAMIALAGDFNLRWLWKIGLGSTSQAAKDAIAAARDFAPAAGLLAQWCLSLLLGIATGATALAVAVSAKWIAEKLAAPRAGGGLIRPRFNRSHARRSLRVAWAQGAPVIFVALTPQIGATRQDRPRWTPTS